MKSADKILSFYKPDVHVIGRRRPHHRLETHPRTSPSRLHQVEPSMSRMQDVFPDRVTGIVTDRGCDRQDNAESLAFVGIKIGICPKNPREMKRQFQEPEFAA